MNAERLAYAFAAGMAATVNPCGFALLPAYLSYYLGLTDDGPGSSTHTQTRGDSSPVLRAIGVGAALTAGFLLVFGIVGAVWSTISSALGDRLPWVTAAMGIGLVILGVSMVAGFQPVVRVPKLQVGKGGQEAWSTFLFGLSYAVASLSCTLPIFIAVTATSSDGFLGGLSSFVAYGLGMGVLVTALTLSVALTREGLVRGLRRLLPHMGRISGGLLIVAGAFVAYYGWAEAHVADNAGIVTRLSSVQGSFQDRLDEFGAGRLGAILGSTIVIAAVVAWWMRRRPDGSPPASGPMDEPAATRRETSA